MVSPQLGETCLFLVYTGPVIPRRESIEAFPVPRPTVLGFVDAAIEGEPITGLILDDASLLVEDAVITNGVPVSIAWDGQFHVKISLSHHPRDQFQRIGSPGITGQRWHLLECSVDSIPKGLTPFDRLNVFLTECAAHDQPHLAVVENQTFDAPSR